MAAFLPTEVGDCFAVPHLKSRIRFIVRGGTMAAQKKSECSGPPQQPSVAFATKHCLRNRIGKLPGAAGSDCLPNRSR